MSVERYFAICDPLRSRSWQTLRHAQRIIAAVWIASLLLMLPIAMLSQLKPIKDSAKMKCREDWGEPLYERLFTLFLDALLLVLPLLGMVATYSRIATTLRAAMQQAAAGRSPSHVDGKNGKYTGRLRFPRPTLAATCLPSETKTNQGEELRIYADVL
ncbi:hypothetical protein HPB48_018419 [Haemaphysalis longicornis]|uniref:G-protein coupled receptors family 1 profile domain-containing protein n=1 Tax=Haemaphysalis longicornis TaxID=44386 RepID=A0A9J6G4N8_HAELO|nr:hypothetical protein HPB48_018419 [Haemaphysalis longicornis]